MVFFRSSDLCVSNVLVCVCVRVFVRVCVFISTCQIFLFFFFFKYEYFILEVFIFEEKEEGTSSGSKELSWQGGIVSGVTGAGSGGSREHQARQPSAVIATARAAAG